MPAPKSVAVLAAELLPAATIIYSQGFDSFPAGTTAPDGWMQVVGPVTAAASALGVTPRSAPNVLKIGPATFPNGTNDASTSKAFDTIPGRAYTLRLWHDRQTSVSGVTTFTIAGQTRTDASTSWTEVVIPFTAAGTTETLTVTGGCGIDDVTLTLEPEPVPLDVVDAEVTLDDSRAPYAEARLTVHVPGEDRLEMIDPREDQRVRLVAELSWAEPSGRVPQERTFDLMLHERTIGHEAGTLALVCESDEALLIDGGNATAAVDAGAEAHQSSLRAIVDYVLAKHGAALEAGTDDADFTVNGYTDPSFEAGVTGWTGGSGTSSVVSSTTFARTGTKCLRWTSNTTAASYLNAPNVTVVAGRSYTVQAWVRSSVARQMRLMYRWYNASNVQIGADATTTAVTDTTTGWTLLAATLTAPAGAVRLNLYPHAVAGASGDLHYLDDVLVHDGAWPNVDALKQQPGDTDWDFLDPLIRTSALRLFCDEQRAWRLVDPAAYRVEGETRVSEGTNATAGSDTISRQATRPDGSPVWYTGIVVKYTWTDENGIQRTAYDAAGTPQKVYRIELARPFPGAGYAAARLRQAQGRGRTQQLEALAELTATPGQTLVSTLPATPIQLGVVSAVTWYWSAESDRHDLMAVRSRGLTDTPETAWYFAEGEWGEVAGIGWDDITTGGQ